jgi:hypothetical protein
MDVAMKSEPDGYTILITNDNAASAPHILKPSYDYTKVLVPVILIATQPQIFAAHPDLDVSSVAEYVAYAKKNPGLGFASSGVGSNQHVVGLWFAKEADIKLEHVPLPRRRAGGHRFARWAREVGLPRAHLDDPALQGRLTQIPGADIRQARADAAGSPDHGGCRLQGSGAGSLVRRLRTDRHAGRAGRDAQ